MPATCPRWIFSVSRASPTFPRPPLYCHQRPQHIPPRYGFFPRDQKCRLPAIRRLIPQSRWRVWDIDPTWSLSLHWADCLSRHTRAGPFQHHSAPKRSGHARCYRNRHSDRHRSVRCGAGHASTHHHHHWAAINPDRGCKSLHTVAGQDQYQRAEKIFPELSASRSLWAVCLHPQRRRHTRKNV